MSCLLGCRLLHRPASLAARAATGRRPTVTKIRQYGSQAAGALHGPVSTFDHIEAPYMRRSGRRD
jgi:hypothetical protein